MNVKMNNQREKLLTSDITSLFYKLSIPGMIGMIVVGLYNLVDAIFVGQLIGKAGVGAIALVYSVVLVNQSILTLVGSGSMSVLSISMGQKKQKKIDKLLGNLIVSILIGSGLLTIVVLLNIDSIVSFIGGQNEVHKYAVRYLRILSLGFIPAAMGPAMNFLVRAEGKMKTAMIIVGGAGILNIILDPIFISVFKMGIEGAAVATVISQVCCMIAQLIYFWKGKSVIRLNKTKFKIAKDIMPQVMKVGTSQMMMLLVGMFQQIALYRTLQAYGGNDQVALMGASFKIFQFSYIAIWGLGQGMQSVIGVNYGAKNYIRIKEAFKIFTRKGLVFSSVIWLLFMIIPNEILGCFIRDVHLVKGNANLFRIMNCIFFSYIYFSTIINLFVGLGKSKEVHRIVICRQVIFFLPLVYILSKLLGVIGVWISLPLSNIFALLLGVYYKSQIFNGELAVMEGHE